VHNSVTQVIMIGDGMGGRPVPSLDGQTCLEAGDYPALDEVAKGGECGYTDPIRPGQAVGSDTGHMVILGYDPIQYYTGRGPFELPSRTASSRTAALAVLPRAPTS